MLVMELSCRGSESQTTGNCFGKKGRIMEFLWFPIADSTSVHCSTDTG